VKLGQFDTSHLGFTDTVDLKFDPVSGHIYILDGVALRLYELTAQGKRVGSMKLPSVMMDAEALAYDSAHDVFLVASGASPTIGMMSRTGEILATIDVLKASGHRNPVTGAAPAPKGLELAPSRDPNDGRTVSLYVVDYGQDRMHDGRLFEIRLGPDWYVGAPASEAGNKPGSDGSDVLHGSAQADRLYGGNGDDVLFGYAGGDRLFGGAGHDRLCGHAGSDRLYGNAGNDVLQGGPHNDILIGGTGAGIFLIFPTDGRASGSSSLLTIRNMLPSTAVRPVWGSTNTAIGSPGLRKAIL
jgi:hypothetical protein